MEKTEGEAGAGGLVGVAEQVGNKVTIKPPPGPQLPIWSPEHAPSLTGPVLLTELM